MMRQPATRSTPKDGDCLRFRATPHGRQSSDVESVSSYPSIVLQIYFHDQNERY